MRRLDGLVGRAVDAGDHEVHLVAGGLQAFRQRQERTDVAMAAPGLHADLHRASSLSERNFKYTKKRAGICAVVKK
jgi:hypothetical protein